MREQSNTARKSPDLQPPQLAPQLLYPWRVHTSHMTLKQARAYSDTQSREETVENNLRSSVMTNDHSDDSAAMGSGARQHARSDSAPSILVVDPDPDELIATASLLTLAGFAVTAVDCFTKARPLIATHYPAILLTAFRLDSHNGLHLVVRGKALQPAFAAVVTSSTSDETARFETERLGATFVARPVAPDELIAAILRTYFREAAMREPIRPPYERRVVRGHGQNQSVATPHQTDRRRPLPWLKRGR